MPHPTAVPVAPELLRLKLGRGITESNVYFLVAGTEWVLVDTGWPKHAAAIRTAAAIAFGSGRPPLGILLTHFHPDHSGAAPELLRSWDAPLWVHPDELPFARGGYDPDHAHPLDRYVVAPMLRLLPPDRIETARQRTSLEGIARGFDPDQPLPNLREWRCVPTPGHTAGHASYFRDSDRVLISGDALLTVNTNSLLDLASGRRGTFLPPRITTWDWARAQQSHEALLDLEPAVIAAGHGPVLRRRISSR